MDRTRRNVLASGIFLIAIVILWMIPSLSHRLVYSVFCDNNDSKDCKDILECGVMFNTSPFCFIIGYIFILLSIVAVGFTVIMMVFLAILIINIFNLCRMIIDYIFPYPPETTPDDN